MAKKTFFWGIFSIMLLFAVFEAAAVHIEARFVCIDEEEDYYGQIVLRKDGTCTITIDGESVSGTYEMDNYIVRGSITSITFYLNDGSTNRFTCGWGINEPKPWIAVGDWLYEMDSGLRR
jgi:hypothetical protein